MSNDKGIFEPQEGFASEPSSRTPFTVDDSIDSPFASTPDGKSPFALNDDSLERAGSGGTKIPEKRSDPFASEDSNSPFGYEPPLAGFGGSPFEGSPSPSVSKDSPFAMADVAKEEPKKEIAEATSPIAAPKSGVPSDAIAAAVASAAATPSTPTASTPPSLAATPAPVPAPGSIGAPAVGGNPDPAPSIESDSSSIPQLELRAIFGVDRELSENEILQRSRDLPGIRHLGRIADADVGMIDGIKRVLANLDFGAGKVQLQCNNAPIEFIREGSVMLAVQTDGSFAPGVRETLIIVARELARM